MAAYTHHLQKPIHLIEHREFLAGTEDTLVFSRMGLLREGIDISHLNQCQLSRCAESQLRTMAFKTCFASTCRGNHPYKGSFSPEDLDEPEAAIGGASVYGLVFFLMVASYCTDRAIGRGYRAESVKNERTGQTSCGAQIS